MILMKDAIFCDPREDLVLPVVDLTYSDGKAVLDTKHFYLIGDLIYRYSETAPVDDVPPGTIIRFGDRYYAQDHTEETADAYSERYIISKTEYENRISGAGSIEDMMQEYARNYRASNNIIRSGNIKIAPIGDIYMPELDENDDPLERIIKMMLRHMKPVMNEYRGQFDKKHGLDNIKSALNGATKNMSILKFLAWCDSFELDWDIAIDNADNDVPNPLGFLIELSNREPYPWMDIPEETKDCFTVPLVKGEDPLKRGIKLALGQKRIDLKDYRKKSPTPHLINNMKSALKSSQKMTLPYFINWCEIIDMIYSFRVINRSDGIWYKITGYETMTNDKETE